MSDGESPARGALALARVPVERRERRALLLWRGLLAALALAVYTVTGVVAAAFALAPLWGQPLAGRRAGAARAAEADADSESTRQALP